MLSLMHQRGTRDSFQTTEANPQRFANHKDLLLSYLLGYLPVASCHSSSSKGSIFVGCVERSPFSSLIQVWRIAIVHLVICSTFCLMKIPELEFYPSPGVLLRTSWKNAWKSGTFQSSIRWERASLRAIGVGFKPNSPKEEPGNSNAVRSLSKKRASKVAGRQAAKMWVGELLVCLVGDRETNQ